MIQGLLADGTVVQSLSGCKEDDVVEGRDRVGLWSQKDRNRGDAEVPARTPQGSRERDGRARVEPRGDLVGAQRATGPDEQLSGRYSPPFAPRNTTVQGVAADDRVRGGREPKDPQEPLGGDGVRRISERGQEPLERHVLAAADNAAAAAACDAAAAALVVAPLDGHQRLQQRPDRRVPAVALLGEPQRLPHRQRRDVLVRGGDVSHSPREREGGPLSAAAAAAFAPVAAKAVVEHSVPVDYPDAASGLQPPRQSSQERRLAAAGGPQEQRRGPGQEDPGRIVEHANPVSSFFLVLGFIAALSASNGGKKGPQGRGGGFGDGDKGREKVGIRGPAAAPLPPLPPWPLPWPPPVHRQILPRDLHGGQFHPRGVEPAFELAERRVLASLDGPRHDRSGRFPREQARGRREVRRRRGDLRGPRLLLR